MPIKVCDISKIKALGWEPKKDLKIGILKTYNWFVQNYEQITEQKFW